MRSEHLGGRVVLHGGDCLEVMASLPENSVDSVICDPPYHLTSIVKRFGEDGKPLPVTAAQKRYGDGSYSDVPLGKNPEVQQFNRLSRGFMGKVWDGGDIAFRPETWAAALRVLKPGGYILAFASTRGFGRMSVAIEDAGFITHPMIAWIFGTGFPKATRVKAEGYEGFRYGGQALKPAIEPIYMGQKPFSEGTGTANILRWGTGAVNIDGCRVDAPDGVPKFDHKGQDAVTCYGDGPHGSARTGIMDATTGRWPANIVHDGSDEVVAAFPSAPGQQRAVGPQHGAKDSVNVYGDYGPRDDFQPRNDSGSAARYFYSAQENDTEWLVRNLNLSHADIAEFLSFPPNGAVCSALSDAVTSGLPAEAHCEVLYPERIMSVTATELRVIAEAAIAATQAIGERCLHGLPLESTTALPNLAQFALHRTPTGIITITISHWTSDGCADPVTFNITPLNSAVGAPDCAPSTARLFYSSKADKQDRIGSKHPTVKPVDLMQWLCRLVTPPGGTVLDPFAGSGSTGEAAWREGFQCVLIEREPEYQADIAERLRLADKGPLERRRRAIKQTNEIGGLFANDNTKDTQIAA